MPRTQPTGRPDSSAISRGKHTYRTTKIGRLMWLREGGRPPCPCAGPTLPPSAFNPAPNPEKQRRMDLHQPPLGRTHLSQIHGEAVGVPQHEGVGTRQLAVLGVGSLLKGKRWEGGVVKRRAGQLDVLGVGGVPSTLVSDGKGAVGQASAGVGGNRRSNTRCGRQQQGEWRRGDRRCGREGRPASRQAEAHAEARQARTPAATPSCPTHHLVELLQALHQGAGEGGLLVRDYLPAATKQSSRRLWPSF